MKHVRLRITADGNEGDIHPMYGVMANADFVEYATAIHWSFTGEELGILHYVEGDVDAFEAAVQSIPEVVDYELNPAGGRSFYAFIKDETNEAIRDMWALTSHRGIVTIPPIEYHEDGTVTFSMFGPGDEIQGAIEGLTDLITVTVEEISGMQALPQTAPSALTDRQREAVEAAIDVGYYEVPRTGSQADVAERLDCSPSTAAEHLRKAEARVLRSLFG